MMLNEQEHNIVKFVLELLKDSGMTTKDIEEKILEVNKLFKYDCDLNRLVKYIESVYNTTIDEGVSLVGNNKNHDTQWTKKIPDEQKIYAKAYERYLKDGKLPHKIVNQLSRTNDEILSLLGNPNNHIGYFHRGLVIGDVQSGKTGNYLSLITKAADAGYKFIIVIAGIHNNLRKQTQQRIEEGFVGRTSSNLNNSTNVGVGLLYSRTNTEYPHPISLTNQEDDFNKKFANQMQTEIKDFVKPVIVVIKKNVSTLKNLYDWLNRFNRAERSSSQIDIPMLMIDDESDNASINTNDAENDPTTTNKYLRDILHMFTKSCYVGYTATPFANIFIDPDSYGEAQHDLFPEDFIYSLDAPTNYFGPEKIFLNDDFDYVVRQLDEEEVAEYLPEKHKKTLELINIPKSLKFAILNFLIAKIIRNIRGDDRAHCSMLINVSSYVDVQKQVKNYVLDFLSDVRQEVLMYGLMPNALQQYNIKMLHEVFNDEYDNVQDAKNVIIEWSRILTGLVTMFDDSPKRYEREVLIINSKSEDRLDYDRYKNEGLGLMAIVVGGFSLSRGLTIEGLIISYFHRSTKMYDTLLQMGRWFGYRVGYEDLCRIYMTSTALRWYQHITNATSNLRAQIIEMKQNNKTPREFGLYVQASDDGLIITAKNKMRNASKLALDRSFSGELKELYSLTKDNVIQRYNYDLFKKLWDYVNTQDNIPDVFTSAIAFKNVKTVEVICALNAFQYGMDEFISNRLILEDSLLYLYELISRYPNMDVTFATKEYKKGANVSFDLIKALDRKVIESEHDHFVLNKSRVGGQHDESYGLLDREIDSSVKNIAIEYRKRRGKPLLLIYFINPTDGKLSYLEDHYQNIGIPTFALSFPFGDGDIRTTKSIMVNKIFEQAQNSFEFEDYDE